MSHKELQDKLHKLLRKTFKGDMTKGYCWVKSLFGCFNVNTNKISEETLNQMILCTESKKDQLACPIHTRIHGKV